MLFGSNSRTMIDFFFNMLKYREMLGKRQKSRAPLMATASRFFYDTVCEFC